MEKVIYLTGFEIKKILRGKGNALVMMTCLLLIGIFFSQYLQIFFNQGGGSVLSEVITPLYGNLHFLLIFYIPMSTLRVISEDDESGMSETLDMLNVDIGKRVMSKFFAVFTQILILILSVSLFSLTLLGTGFDQWVLIILNSLMISMLAGCYVSLGIFANSVFSNFILAGTFHLFLILLFFSFSFIEQVMPFHILGKLFSFLSLSTHFSKVVKGIFSFETIVYYMSFSFVFLYAAIKRREL